MMASVRADFVPRGPGVSNFNSTITVHDRIYQRIGAHIPPVGKKPRFAAVYIHDTDKAVKIGSISTVYFGKICFVDLNICYMKSTSLCGHLSHLGTSCIRIEFRKMQKLVIHAHERTNPDHKR